MSVHSAVKWLAWKILNNNPAGLRLIKGKTFKWAVVEAINDKFYITFRFTAPDLTKIPSDNTSTFGE